MPPWHLGISDRIHKSKCLRNATLLNFDGRVYLMYFVDIRCLNAPRAMLSSPFAKLHRAAIPCYQGDEVWVTGNPRESNPPQVQLSITVKGL